MESTAVDPLLLPLEWRDYIIRPDDEKHASWRKFPAAPGVYAMWTEVDDIMYVGRSANIRDRMFRHSVRHAYLSGDPAFFSYRLAPLTVIKTVEIAHIAALEPYENEFYEGGGGRYHAAMMAAIMEHWADVLPAQHARLAERQTKLAEQIAARL